MSIRISYESTNKSCYEKIFLASLVSIVLVAANVSTATVTVSSLADLQKAISKAESGDNLLFSNGIYKTTTDINIDRRGLRINL